MGVSTALTQAHRALNPRWPLGDVRGSVPHDRVDHLEPLPRSGLQGLAMRHAPVAAARVVVAPSVAAARKAVAGEHEQVLRPLVTLPRRGHRRYRRAGPPVARRQPAVRGQPVVAWEVGYVYGHDQLGCRLRPQHGVVRQHHLRQDPPGLVVPGARDGHLVVAHRGIVDGPEHHGRACRRGLENGTGQAKPARGMRAPQRSRLAVRVAAALQDHA